MVINIFEPKKQFETYKNQIYKVIYSVLASGSYILGNEVKKLEKNFQNYLNCKKAIGVKNGTDALILALKVIKIKRGDEVITTAHTAVATIAAIIDVGAIPVIADVEKNYYTINPKEIEKKISRKTRAIIPVHIYGQCCDMKQIIRIAKKNKIFVIEDCSQSLGSKIGNKNIGTFGDIATFSFYPTKNLGAIGDGGMIVTNNSNLGKKLCRLREYGWDKNRFTLEPGINSRLDEIQAGILNIKINDLNNANKKRIKILKNYTEKISNKLVKLPKKNKINPGIHYLRPACLNKGYKEKCIFTINDIKKTLFISKNTVSLPIYPELQKKNVERIVKVINKFRN